MKNRQLLRSWGAQYLALEIFFYLREGCRKVSGFHFSYSPKMKPLTINYWKIKITLVKKCTGRKTEMSHNFDNIVFHIASLLLDWFLSNLTNCAVNCGKYYLNCLRTTNSIDIYIPPAVQLSRRHLCAWKLWENSNINQEKAISINNRNKRIYFSTSWIRFTCSSSEPPTSKKSSTTVVSTPLFAHDMRASESSGEKIVAAQEK